MLEQATKQRMEEMLSGHFCCRCRRPARRICRDRYLCHECHLRSKQAMSIQPVRATEDYATTNRTKEKR
jgi:hypothetical protein